MKALKMIDAVIQIFLVTYYLIKAYAIYRGGNNLLFNDPPFLGYFIVGGYQFTSYLFQLPYVRGKKQPAARVLYQKMIVILGILAAIMIPVFVLFLYVLLIVSPFLAIFYCWLSIDETIKLIRYEK